MPASQSQSMPDGSKPTPHGGGMTTSYSIFGVPISSQIPLPELPLLTELPGGQGTALRITIRLDASGHADLAGFANRYDWRDDSGRLLCQCARREDEYRLWLPQQASFHLAPGGVISCTPAPGVEPGLLRHLLLNQVLPRYMAHAGELVLHASAVTLPNGKTVAFLGDSGQGKSTLAYYCQQQGAQIIDDDCFVLRVGESGVNIIGGAPTLRLYPDSLHALGHAADRFSTYVNYSEKQQMCLTADATAGPGPYALHALFLLGSPGEAPAGSVVRITHAAGQAALMAIVRSAFTLDPADPNTMTRTFVRAGQALTQGLPVYHLHFPRAHSALPQVLQALLDHQRG